MSVVKSSPRNLLVIDDDPIMREVLSAVLGMEGYTVHLAESGDEGIVFLTASTTPMDVILVDLHMPGLQGLQLAERLNNLRTPGTPLIGMSGSRPSSDEMGIYSAFLDKPFTIAQFNRALAAATAAEASSLPAAPTQQSPQTVLDETIFARLAAILPRPQLRELYRITIADVLRRVELMRISLASGDFPACQREAHAIKGGCGMVGATSLSALAATVETAPGAPSLPHTGSGAPFAEFTDACTELQVMLDLHFLHE